MDTLLFNPNAGKAKKIGLTPEDLASRFYARGIEVEYPPCATEAEILDAATRSGGRVIVAGGDGTIHALLQAVDRCRALRLGIIPVGSANHLANALGIPTDIDAAIDVFAEGHTREIDLGRVNGVVFSQAAGVGFHAAIFRAYGERTEKSRVDAISAAIATFSDWAPQLVRVIIDGVPYVEEVFQVTAANTSMYGGQFQIAPDAVIDDGLLDVIIVGSLNKVEIIEYSVAAAMGAHLGLAKTYITRAKRVEVAAVGDEQLAIHADAMSVGFTPAEIEVLPGCLQVVVPEAVP